jgi:hypothetical protein
LLDSTTHISQAKHNEKLVDHLAPSAFTDWQATGMFYAALHYISAYFSENRIKGFKTHRERDVAVKQHLLKIYFEYRSLKDGSENARYECEKPNASALADMSESLEIIKQEIGKHVPLI